MGGIPLRAMHVGIALLVADMTISMRMTLS
jgi:hypothetical protein